MSWTSTLVDLGIISVQISQLKRLEQLQRQNAEAALIQVVVQALRNEIFKYREAAREILDAEAAMPEIAAGAMGILHERFRMVGFSPDSFPDLKEKEYVAATARLIRKERERLLQQLEPAQRDAVRSIVKAATYLPSLDYYVNYYETISNYRQALASREKLKWRKNGCLQVSVMLGLLILLPTITSIIFGAMGSLLGEEVSSLARGVGAGTGLVMFLVTFVYINNSVFRSAEAARAGRQIRDFERSNVDLEYFETLEKRYGTDYGRVAAARDTALRQIERFFGDTDLSASLPT